MVLAAEWRAEAEGAGVVMRQAKKGVVNVARESAGKPLIIADRR